MKKTITIIGKALLKAAMFLAGFLAFCYIVGEPTDQWWAWAHRTFGVLCGLWCIIEKALAGLLIYGIYLLDQKVGPMFPDDIVSPEATEGR